MDNLIITDEELQMDIELQNILDMACKQDGMEEISECIPPLNTFDGKFLKYFLKLLRLILEFSVFVLFLR